MKHSLNIIQAICDELSDMSPEEADVIEKQIDKNTVSYKLSVYRTGTKLPDETKLKLSQFNKGKSISQETKLKLSKFFKGRIPYNKGVSGKISEETKAKMSAAHKARAEANGRTIYVRPSKAKKLYKHSDEYKAKLINAIDECKTKTEICIKFNIAPKTLNTHLAYFGLVFPPLYMHK